MISVDCSELDTDRELALAAEISDSLEGRSIALVKGDRIVFDQLANKPLKVEALEKIVSTFVSKLPNGDLYQVESEGETVMIRSPDPMTVSKTRNLNNIPPNLMKCPHCGFITEFEEVYVVHTRAHLGI